MEDLATRSLPPHVEEAEQRLPLEMGSSSLLQTPLLLHVSPSQPASLVNTANRVPGVGDPLQEVHELSLSRQLSVNK